MSKQSIAQKGTPPFTARLMNIEAAANTTFTYNTKLRNAASLPRIYQLSATIPPGWNIAFKVEGMQVTSLNIDSGRTQDITIEINPTIQTKPGKYAIPVVATAGSDSTRLNLEAVVKGTYTVQLTTPSGRLSDDVTEGSRKEIHLLVKNTGTIALENLALSAQAPPQWETTFSPSTITRLEPGKDEEVIATLHVPDKTIAGDYVTTFSARNNNSSSDAAFRMTVRTSVLTGWLGLLVILVALGVVYYLIRKYGRR
ncbi:NEW3 domain-containing protein [Chitinophaga oryziterrae]|uniref:COG1470 family protein n=1 Tax=Chitinophaga oryziterrae TaxID=1031224 RepID=UPI001F0F219F|nr:NEW3 domain-containing protein [Chitinophaga oryziterrae]